MTKPINVEAQRIIKILEDTYRDMQILSILNRELFDEVAKRQVEDLQQTYGNEVGKLLMDEAICEGEFDSLNTNDGQHMVSYNSDDFEPADKIRAMKNEKAIASNIQKLVRVFRRPEKEAQLRRDFKDVISKKEDQYSYPAQFEKMMGLWKVKLCTSLEEATRMQDQLQISSKRVQELEDTKKTRKNDLEKFQSTSRDARETSEKQIEDLKQTQSKHKQDRYQRQVDLDRKGKHELDKLLKDQETREAELKAKIEGLTAELEAHKKTNREKETNLQTSYQQSNTVYTEALDSYDTEMRDAERRIDNAKKTYDDEAQQLQLMRTQWEERKEEKRKREKLQMIIDAKKKEQERKLDTLKKAAQFLQAHWRGLMARRDMEKARKGKKGRKRGKR